MHQILLPCLLFLFAVATTPAQENDAGKEPDESPAKESPADEPPAGKPPAGNERVAEIFRTFGGRGVMADDSQPTPATDAVEAFRLRSGFEIDLVASEPTISQPLFATWDSRGRLWCVQYRQYQYPAGLEVIRFDHHLRAVFDRVPEPPPRGTPGADRITVFEDTDGDGLYDASQDVITGLNIATSVQVGHGGIWVLNPPYLLFYPDADRDDVPDADPEVCLSGFGLQDTHSVANSLLWGPDGWLYGANGSTTGGTISSAVTRGVTFEGQCIWRYHPDTRVFEIWAEGGGNTFSLEIDAKGRVFSGTNGGRTRGFHYPQGSYSHKNWGKHGPLTNPYAFGFFREMPSVGDESRFAQAFAIYEGGLFPADMNGSIIAPNAMRNRVWVSTRIPRGSTWRTEDTEDLVVTDDRWFRPVWCGVGPDACVYIADWYDTRLSHISPIDDWHKESGRIYRVRPADSKPAWRGCDLHTLDAASLIARLGDANRWVRHRACLELGWRGDRSVAAQLVALVERSASLEAIWALSALGELKTERALTWLSHSDAHVRCQVLRLLGDRGEGHSSFARLASTEPDVSVRCQLASTAQRIPAEHAIPIVAALASRDENADDPHLPLLTWWALEAHAENWPAIETWISSDGTQDSALWRQWLAGRLMQRYAATEKLSDLAYCERLLELAADESSRELLVAGLDRAFQGRHAPELPDRLRQALDDYHAARGAAPAVLALRGDKPGALDEALRSLRDPATDIGVRLQLAQALGETPKEGVVDTLLGLARGGAKEPALQRLAIRSLAAYDDERIGTSLVSAMGSSISAEHDLRTTACRTLVSRATWARALLAEVKAWRLRPADVPPDVVQRLRSYDDDAMRKDIDDAFGKPVAIDSPEVVAELIRLRKLFRTRGGDAEKGQRLFDEKCSSCHRLFGRGETGGPPLDTYDRGNPDFWLHAILAPSIEIREGYQTWLAVTSTGRSVTGTVVTRDDRGIALRTADRETVTLDRDDLVELRALETSLMPEKLLADLDDGAIADLFEYLRSGLED